MIIVCAQCSTKFKQDDKAYRRKPAVYCSGICKSIAGKKRKAVREVKAGKRDGLATFPWDRP